MPRNSQARASATVLNTATGMPRFTATVSANSIEGPWAFTSTKASACSRPRARSLARLRDHLVDREGAEALTLQALLDQQPVAASRDAFAPQLIEVARHRLGIVGAGHYHMQEVRLLLDRQLVGHGGSETQVCSARAPLQDRNIARRQ